MDLYAPQGVDLGGGGSPSKMEWLSNEGGLGRKITMWSAVEGKSTLGYKTQIVLYKNKNDDDDEVVFITLIHQFNQNQSCSILAENAYSFHMA